jgi:hypothetical protein
VTQHSLQVQFLIQHPWLVAFLVVLLMATVRQVSKLAAARLWVRLPCHRPILNLAWAKRWGLSPQPA